MTMPAYVSVPDLVAMLQASAGVGAATAADLPNERLQAALGDAHAEILGKLSTLYALPADPTLAPDLVKSLITAVAAYVATLEWLQGRDLSDRDPVVLRYQRAQTMLRQVIDGTLTVDGLDSAAAVVYDAVSYETMPPMDLANTVTGANEWRGGYYLPGSVAGGGQSVWG